LLAQGTDFYLHRNRDGANTRFIFQGLKGSETADKRNSILQGYYMLFISWKYLRLLVVS